jgi:hypothetical protein
MEGGSRPPLPSPPQFPSLSLIASFHCWLFHILPTMVVTINQSKTGAQKDIKLQQVLIIKGTKQKYRLTVLK